jgi:hypothetical protein
VSGNVIMRILQVRRSAVNIVYLFLENTLFNVIEKCGFVLNIQWEASREGRDGARRPMLSVISL